MANTIQYGRRSITLIPDGSTDFNLTTIQSPVLPLNTVAGAFSVGETVTQDTSGATGTVLSWDAHTGKLKLSSMTGTFDITHTITGGTSSATAIPGEVSAMFPNGFRLSDLRFMPSQANDTLVVRGRGLVTGPILFQLLSASGSDEKRSVGGRSMREKLYILASEQTWGSAANVRIVMEYD